MSGLRISCFPISLRHGPKDAQKEEPLDVLMSRISQQKGHFRHVTEEELEQEIEEEELGKIQEEESDEEEVKKALPDGKAVRENIIKAKAEMIQQVRYDSCREH